MPENPGEEKRQVKKAGVAIKGNDSVTPEQIQKARDVDLLGYLQRSEPDNLKMTAPGEYGLKDHDSLKISKGKFHWLSRGIGGTNAIDFLVKVRGAEFRDAVRELSGEGYSLTHEPDGRIPPAKHAKQEQSEKERPFTLPEANSHNNDVVKYLTGRGIDESILNDCIGKGLLYQSTKPVCVFVGLDSRSNPKFACERGITSDYKKDIYGSDKAYSFCLPPKNKNPNGEHEPENIYVFEGAIDCLSHASIAIIGGTDWDGYRLSLGGVSALALNTFLENNPQVGTVYICLDNDKAGKDAAARIVKGILANENYNHISVYIAPPPVGKDYNDTLLFMQERLRSRENTGEMMYEEPNPVKKRTEQAL